VGRMVLRFSGGLLRVGLARRWQLPMLRLLAGVAGQSGAVRRRAAGALSGLGIGYRRTPGTHPWIGRRAPDVPLADGTRLYEALRGCRFVLVSADGDPGIDGVRCVRPAAAGATLLVRPDGYIGWAADSPPRDVVRAAVGNWIRPATSAASWSSARSAGAAAGR
jgi:hypothetical protein